MKMMVCGIGKLGSCLVAVLASKGYKVLGVDVNPEYISALNRGEAPVDETGLAELIDANSERIRSTSDTMSAARNADVIFMVVPTPSVEDGSFSCEYVVTAARLVGEAIKDGTWRLVVLVSTVMPGHSKYLVVPALEEASGKVCGRDFSFAYNPEFIALGSVIHNMLNPDFILIGESDTKGGDLLESIYKTVCDNDPPVSRMNYFNAEVAKIALNAFVTTKISYANMLAEICEMLPGGDATIVLDAIGQDERIGRKYLLPGSAYGGPCFPRDNVAFRRMTTAFSVGAEIPEATDIINNRQAERMTELAYQACGSTGRVSVLGLAYKPNTPVAEKSAGVAVCNALEARGVQVVAYDPRAMDDAKLAPGVVLAGSLDECVDEADVVLVMTPWPEFAELQTEATVIDCWRVVNIAMCPKLIRIGSNG